MADRQDVEHVHVFVKDNPVIAHPEPQDGRATQLLHIIGKAGWIGRILFELRLDRFSLLRAPIFVKAASASRL